MKKLVAAFLLLASPALADDFVFKMPVLPTATRTPPPVTRTPSVVTRTTRTVTRSAYRTASAPRWNLSGSWSRVRNRSDLINHLATTHDFDAAFLNSLTIGQLWAIHDDDHDGTTTAREIKRTFSRSATRTMTAQPTTTSTTYCPPGQT